MMRFLSASRVGRAIDEDESPYRAYRSIYKYTACGPSLGLEVREINGLFRRVYCDQLRTLGTWAEMDRAGMRVGAFLVSSIVEGVDECTETIEVPAAPLSTLGARLDAAVKDVDAQADAIWKATHGCEHCGLDGAINPECTACKGEGEII